MYNLNIVVESDTVSDAIAIESLVYVAEPSVVLENRTNA